MELDPYKLIDQETGQRVFGKFMSGEYAWDYIVRLGIYGTVLAPSDAP